MRWLTHSYGRTQLTYTVTEKKPTIFIVSGFHGDESESITPLIQAVTQYEHILPPFLFVPVVSPTAVKLKTRTNEHAIDINRSYFLDTQEEEAKALMTLLENYSFETVYSFHEDPDYTSFYMYDYGNHQQIEQIGKLLRALQRHGISLFTGIDDPSDTTLEHMVIDGYVGIDESNDISKIEYGFFSEYMFSMNKCKRDYTFEIPGMVSTEKKFEIIDIIFRTFITNFSV
jgi:predicted deacylase